MKRNLRIGLILILLATGLAAYRDPQPHGFITFDDDVYITENDMVRKGLTWEGVEWAFTSRHRMYWHPVTWISHMIDGELYGLNAKGHHFSNLLLHIANAVLLFVVLHRISHAPGRSFFVAALFLVHPLGVESVAWASERKNVLAGLFWMLTLLSYVHYTERPSLPKYGLVLLAFVLGLMAKPVLVTLPFLFLVLDYWPLRRMSLSPGMGGMAKPSLVLLGEKIPLLLLSGASVVVSSWVAQGRGTWVPDRFVPFALRIQNAVVSYPIYVKKMLWPFDLAPFYPYPQQIPWWETAAAGLFLVGVTAFTVGQSRKRPYLLVGWLWFAGTLVPVLGLIQQGLWPGVADRFAYLPLIGLYIMIAWGFADLGKPWRVPALGVASLGGCAVVLLGAITSHQHALWRNSVVLFEHTLKVTERSFPAHMNLGIALASEGKEEEAIVQFHHALETGHSRPQDVHYNLGLAYASIGKSAEALLHFRTALAIDPQYVDPHLGLGNLFLRQREWDQSETAWARALELDPRNKKAMNNMGVVMLHRGDAGRAAGWFRAALEIDPGYLMARKNLEIATGKRKLKGSE